MSHKRTVQKSVFLKIKTSLKKNVFIFINRYILYNKQKKMTELDKLAAALGVFCTHDYLHKTQKVLQLKNIYIKL